MTPDASIIVTTYNRPDSLERLLEALCEQDLPRDRFEVVIVDDGSPEPVSSIAERFSKRLRLLLHRQENSGPAVGRNNAIALASGRFLVMVDDDCIPSPDWLSKLVAVLVAAPNAMAGGRTINGLPGNLYSTVSQMVVDRVYAAHNANPNHAGFFTSNNLGVSRDLLLAMGSFDRRYRRAGGEDRGLCDRWRKSGRPMLYVPDATIYHFHHLTLWRFLKQHFNYGRGALHYHLNRESSIREESGTAREIVFNWKAWQAEIRAQAPRHRATRIVFALVLWQVANLMGYAWEAAVRHTPLAATQTGSWVNPGNQSVGGATAETAIDRKAD